MHRGIYSALKKHATTICIAVIVSTLCGAGGAVAASQIHFSQIQGTVTQSQIREGAIGHDQIREEAVSYGHLDNYLRHFIDSCREDCASNKALNAQQNKWGEAIHQAKVEILSQVEAEYVHK
jgi:hypothetical protein